MDRKYVLPATLLLSYFMDFQLAALPDYDEALSLANP